MLAQHVSFLKDFFRAYKDFSDAHIDTIEIMVSKLYAKWGITERSNFRRMRPEDYPILSDLYDLIEEEFKSYDPNAHLLYTEKLLQEVLLGLHSMCKGADAQFFNGHTNLQSDRLVFFNVKDLMEGGKCCTKDTPEMLKRIDVLVDGPFVEEKKDITLKFKGSSNQRVINLKKFCKEGVIETLWQ